MSSDKLEKLRQQKAKLEAQIRREEQKARDAERKAEMRRKIILGGLIKNAAETDTVLQEKVTALVASLSRDDERALFGLEPLPKPVPEQTDAPVSDQVFPAASRLTGGPS